MRYPKTVPSQEVFASFAYRVISDCAAAPPAKEPTIATMLALMVIGFGGTRFMMAFQPPLPLTATQTPTTERIAMDGTAI